MRRLVVAIGVSLLGGCGPLRGEGGAQAGPLAARLLTGSEWTSVSRPGVILHFARGIQGNHAEIADSVSAIRRDVLRFIGEADDSASAHLFVLASREEMQRLAGRPIAGFIQESEKTGVFVASPGYHIEPLLRHELAHLYTLGRWGSSPAGRWIVEGVAGMFAGACQGHSPDALAAGLLAAKRLPSVDSLARDFRALPEDVGMPSVSSLLGHLYRQGGIAAIRGLWSQPAAPGHPLGANGTLVESEWRRSLAAVPPASLDIQRVMREGC